MSDGASWKQRPDPLFHWALLIVCGGVLLLAALLSVRGGTQVGLPGLPIPVPELCMSRRIFGIDCPGCGLTRCFVSLAHGDLRSAWRYNPAGVWLFAIVAFQVPFRVLQLWRISRGRPEITLSRTAQLALGVFAAALLAQWAVRWCGLAF